MRSLLWAAALTLSPLFTGAQAQVLFPPPIPGTPVSFVACPELTGAGTWVATDPVSYFTYSLAGAPPPPGNAYIRVSGVVSPELGAVPGWLLTPISIAVGQTPCRSVGVPQPPRGYLPLFPYVKPIPLPVF